MRRASNFSRHGTMPGATMRLGGRSSPNSPSVEEPGQQTNFTVKNLSD
jgi:hypothetical protein